MSISFFYIVWNALVYCFKRNNKTVKGLMRRKSDDKKETYVAKTAVQK